jgi:hypothetical protein
MCPSSDQKTSDQEQSIRDALARVQTATSRLAPGNESGLDRPNSAMGVGKLHAQLQRFQDLNELCDKAVAEIRASLERPQGEDS